MSIKIDITKKLSSFNLEVNFDHDRGILGFLGASGCGKSMTLKTLCGLVTPSSGQIIINDEIFFDSHKRINVPPQKRNCGYLFQNYALFPTMTIKENIEIGISNAGSAQKSKISSDYIERLNLNGLEKRYPWQLSGGQMQRAAFARALASSPDTLLLDEPFSALDQHLRSTMEKELMSIIKEFKGNVIFVTHDINEAYRVCDEIIVYDNGKSLIKRNKKDLFNKPSSLSEARLTGCRNISKAVKSGPYTITAEDWGYEYKFKEPVPDNIQYICIRPHHIEITNTGDYINTYPFTITKIIENPFDFTICLENENISSSKIIEITLSKKEMKYHYKDTLYLKFDNEYMFYI